MSVRYLVAKNKGTDWEDPRRLGGTLRRARGLLRDRGESYVIRRKGGDVSSARDLAATMDRLETLLRTSKVGEQFNVLGRFDLGPVMVRIVEDTPPPDTSVCGIQAVKVFAGFVRDRWPDARFAGSCVCKHTSGTTWSDHAYGAAIDYFDSWANMEAMRDFAVANFEPLEVRYVILADRIWSRLGGWSNYGGSYHSHIHVSFMHGPDRIAC